MKISHLISAFIILFLTLFLAGCQTSRPIKTTLDLTTDPSPALNYSSEKDVLYSRTTTDPATGIVDSVSFKALASAAAYAQAERDAIQAQANASQAQALAESVSALGAIAGRVINPARPAVPPAEPELAADLNRGRFGAPGSPAP